MAEAPATQPPVDPEQHWVDHVRVADPRQLTMRAIVMGMLLGAVMCLSNLYVFFKTGWSLGVTITAAILAYTLCQAMHAAQLMKRPLSALENNALTTVASGAGFMTGGGNMAAFGALLMLTSVRPDDASMMVWFAVIAAMGVFAALPIKRQLINKEGLAFPTGTATAETIRSLHAAASAAAKEKARALGYSALFAAALTWMRDAKADWMPFNIPGSIALPFSLAGKAAAAWTLAIKTEVILMGAGALMSLRTGWSLLFGAVLTYGVLAPALVADGLVKNVAYKDIVGWTVWPGAALLVASGLTSFLMDWRSAARAFSGLTAVFRKRRETVAEPIEAYECPTWWFPAGFAVLAPIVVALMAYLFQIPVWAGIIAVPLAVVMGFVAARVTGETDTTPTKALGPVTQLVYGVLTPGNLTGNIMAANVTGGVGLHAADLLTTLKTGWLLGASPRVQFWAQLFGVVAGAAIVVPAFNLLIDNPADLGTEAWPAPSCLVWAGVSRSFSDGLGALDPLAQKAILIAALLGVALALAEKWAPRRAQPFIPSPGGLGIAMVIPGSNAISMFLGALAGHLWRKYRPASSERYLVSIASGLIAGESLMGIAVALLIVGGVLTK